MDQEQFTHERLSQTVLRNGIECVDQELIKSYECIVCLKRSSSKYQPMTDQEHRIHRHRSQTVLKMSNQLFKSNTLMIIVVIIIILIIIVIINVVIIIIIIDTIITTLYEISPAGGSFVPRVPGGAG